MPRTATECSTGWVPDRPAVAARIDSADMSGGLFLGLGAAIAWGLTDVAASIAGRRYGSLRVLVTTQVVGVAVLAGIGLVAVVVGGASPVLDPSMIVLASLSGIALCLGYLGAFTALRIGPVSVVSPVISAYGGLTVVLAIVIRGESMTSVQAAGAIVATIGVMLVGLVIDEGWRSTRIAGPGVAFAVLALLGFAFGTLLIAEPTRVLGFLPAITVARIVDSVVAVALLVVALVRRPGWAGQLLSAEGHLVGRVRTWPAWAIVLTAGLLDVAGFVAFGIGLETSLVWLVGLVSSFGPVFAVAVAVLVLGERPRPVQWFGMAAIGLGIVLIGLP